MEFPNKKAERIFTLPALARPFGGQTLFLMSTVLCHQVSSRHLLNPCYAWIQPVTKVTFGIDRIASQNAAKFLPQFADMAFNNVVLNLLIKNAVDCTKDLSLRNPSSVQACKIFEDTSLTTWKLDLLSIDFHDHDFRPAFLV